MRISTDRMVLPPLSLHSHEACSRAAGEQRFDQPITDGGVEPEMPVPTFDIADHLVDVLGRTFLMDRDESGDLHRAEVLRRADDLDDDLESCVVKIGEKCEDIVAICRWCRVSVVTSCGQPGRRAPACAQ